MILRTDEDYLEAMRALGEAAGNFINRMAAKQQGKEAKMEAYVGMKRRIRSRSYHVAGKISPLPAGTIVTVTFVSENGKYVHHDHDGSEMRDWSVLRDLSEPVVDWAKWLPPTQLPALNRLPTLKKGQVIAARSGHDGGGAVIRILSEPYLDKVGRFKDLQGVQGVQHACHDIQVLATAGHTSDKMTVDSSWVQHCVLIQDVGQVEPTPVDQVYKMENLSGLSSGVVTTTPVKVASRQTYDSLMAKARVEDGVVQCSRCLKFESKDVVVSKMGTTAGFCFDCASWRTWKHGYNTARLLPVPKKKPEPFVPNITEEDLLGRDLPQPHVKGEVNG